MEDVVIYNDKTLESYYTEDSLKAYLLEIEEYPLLSKDEFNQLFDEYKNGDLSAREWIIKCNLRLVLSVAYKYRDRLKQMQLLDVIQEGNMGLIRALETYDPSISAFSTYAWNWIVQRIVRGLGDKNSEIRIAAWVYPYLTKYRKIVDDCKQNNREVPSDDELCDILNISLNSLQAVKDASGISITSMNMTVDDDGDSELEDFVPVIEQGYERVVQQMHDRDIYLVLKEVLSPLQYYIVFNRVLNDEMTLEMVGNLLGITRERVRQLENAALKRVRPYLEGEQDKFYGVLNRLRNRKGKLIDRLRLGPIEPNDIIFYYYVKDYLSDEERDYLYKKYFSRYEEKTDDFYEDVLRRKFKGLLRDKEKYKRFREIFIKNYGTKMFTMDKDAKIDLIDYRRIKSTYDSKSFEEIEEFVKRAEVKLGLQEWELLRRYFSFYEVRGIPKETMEREINLVKYGYSKRYVGTPKEKLYETYLRNKEEFNSEQQEFLEGFYFKVREVVMMTQGVSKSRYYYTHYYLIEKLEKMYYGILNYFENSFGKREYLVVKKKYESRLGSERIKLLDMYYGMERDYTIVEIAESYEIDYGKMHGLIRDARDAAYNIYMGLSNKLEIDKRKYIPYIKSNDYEFTDETRMVLSMYLVDEFTYDEIAMKTGLSNYRISNIVTEGIRKIDFYRFGISKPFVVKKKELMKFFDWAGKKMGKLDKDVLTKRFIKRMSNSEIAEGLGLTAVEIAKIIRRFYLMYESYLLEGVRISDVDILEEVMLYRSESVLNEREREFASFYIGALNEYNQEGIRLDSEGMMKRFGYSKNVYLHLYRDMVRAIKGKKAGIRKSELGFYKRSELIEILKDKNLPISDKERLMICHLFEIDNYPYKSIEELATSFNEKSNSLRRRYYRAIVTIGKYIKKEIQGSISYEEDIVPIRKYFPRIEQVYIDKYYRDNLSYEALAKEMGVTFNQVISVIGRVRSKMFEIKNNPRAKKFDFEYYEVVKNSDDLPFFGDRKVAIEIFDLYFGMNGKEKLSIPEIIKKLDLSFGSTVALRIVYGLMIATCKHQEGIRVGKVFSYQDVVDYYEENKDTMGSNSRTFYERYFNLFQGKMVYSTKYRMSPKITFDLIRARNDDYLQLDKMDMEEMGTFLRSYGSRLQSDIRYELMALYEFRGRHFMNGRDVNHVFKIIHNVEEKVMRMESSGVLELKS